MIIGTVLASAIQLLTGYFTEANRRPVCDIGNSSETVAATVILAATVALIAAALAGIGLLTTVGVMDSLGPVTDNARGIAEMSGEVEDNASVALTRRPRIRLVSWTSDEPPTDLSCTWPRSRPRGDLWPSLCTADLPTRPEGNSTLVKTA